MGFFEGSIYSKCLRLDTNIGIVLPHDSRKSRGVERFHEGVVYKEKPKTLILLHGLSDNWSAWAHRTSILRYAEDYCIAVLMPEVQRSFYRNMCYGLDYFSYIADELPILAQSMFNISIEPDDLMVAGLSMGGYGALLCGLTNPERFSYVGSFSGVCDIASFINDTTEEEEPGWSKDKLSIFGKDYDCLPSMDINQLIGKVSGKSPKFYITCGLQDTLRSQSLQLQEILKRKQFSIKYEEWPGAHSWEFWDISIQKMLEYSLLEQ